MKMFSKNETVFVCGQIGGVYYNYKAIVIEDNGGDTIKVENEYGVVEYPQRRIVDGMLSNY